MQWNIKHNIQHQIGTNFIIIMVVKLEDLTKFLEWKPSSYKIQTCHVSSVYAFMCMKEVNYFFKPCVVGAFEENVKLMKWELN